MFAGIVGSAVSEPGVPLWIGPEPSRIWSRTTFSIELSLNPWVRSYANAASRLGPTLPLAPAAASVWQLAQFDWKSFWPGLLVGLPGRDAARAAAGREQPDDGETCEPDPDPTNARAQPRAAPLPASASSRSGRCRTPCRGR